ncbi:MAG: tetratricopeptide repeat protein [Rectinemataceae bacterium]
MKKFLLLLAMTAMTVVFAQAQTDDIKTLTKNAEKGDAKAQYSLGMKYYAGEGVASNPELAFKWFEKAAAQGNADAQTALGIQYFNGDGVAKNIHEALVRFEAAAEKKNLDAQLNLGWIYGHTDGFLDPKKSAKYYGMAAAQGDAEAQYLYGLMYLNGEGVGKDAVKASEWLRKSALQGKVEAQSALGDLYENGKGVKLDKVEALMWYLIARKNGDPVAEMFADSIKTGMKAAQIADAEKKAAAF